MLSREEIEAYSGRLILCPHCGGDGRFDLITDGDLVTVQTCCCTCGHTSDDFYPSKENVLRLIEEWGEGSPAHRLEFSFRKEPEFFVAEAA